ncbi:MAG: transcription termination factor NusA [bacterium]|nr:transcription termination factor NusA [bacterium]
MPNGFSEILKRIEETRNIPREEIIERIKLALKDSYKRHFGDDDVEIEFNEKSSDIFSLYTYKKVVEKPISSKEIDIKTARNIDPQAKVGDLIRYPVDKTAFSRIAAERIKDAIEHLFMKVDRQKVYEKYKNKIGELLGNGSVIKLPDGNILVEFDDGTLGYIPKEERIRNEELSTGLKIKTLLINVINEKTPHLENIPRRFRHIQLILSRARPEFVIKLMENEIPELKEKIIEIYSIARIAGYRTKVCVYSKDPKIPAKRSCLGIKNSRIDAVKRELSYIKVATAKDTISEDIQIIEYNPDIRIFVADALHPGQIISTNIISQDEKKIEVIVADSEYDKVCGRFGQNLELAKKLTGWDIVVIKEQERAKIIEDSNEKIISELTKIEGIGRNIAEVLVKGGIKSIKQLSELEPEKLTVFHGIGEKLAVKIVESARKIYEESKQ